MKFSNSNSQSKITSISKVKVMLILLAIQAQIFISALTSPQAYAQGGGSGFSEDCPCMLPDGSGVPCQIDIPDGDPPDPNSSSTADCCVDGVETWNSDTCTPNAPQNPPGGGQTNIGSKTGIKEYIRNVGVDYFWHPRYGMVIAELDADFSHDYEDIMAEEKFNETDGVKDCTTGCGSVPTPPNDDGGKITFAGSLRFSLQYGAVTVSATPSLSAEKNKEAPDMCNNEATPFYKWCTKEYERTLKPVSVNTVTTSGKLVIRPQGTNFVYGTKDIEPTTSTFVDISGSSEEIINIKIMCCKHRCCNNNNNSN